MMYLAIRTDCRVSRIRLNCHLNSTYSPSNISRAGSNLDNTFHLNGQLRANGCRYRLSGHSRLRAHRQLFSIQ
jgi:hypothetical protein